jgi:hypothetical protein
MNEYRPKAAWTQMLRNKFDGCLQVARRFRFTAALEVVSEPIKKCLRSLQQYRVGDVVSDFCRSIYYKFMGLEKGVRLLVGSVAAVLMVALLVTTSTGAQFGSRTWEGTWTNGSSNSGGPLTCVANEVNPGEWEGTFTGVWKEEPYKYKVAWKAKPGSSETLSLSGSASVDDHNYKWSGMMRGKTFRGRYNSTVGYQGEFVLNEK